MNRILFNIGCIALIVMTFSTCKNHRAKVDINVLDEGIYEITETDSGKIQIQEKHPIGERMEQLKVPGLSIAIIDDYNICDILTFGKGDSTTSVNRHTIFQAGSVSKFLTAVIVHHYITQGLLDLDTDINQYLKSWEMPNNDFTNDNPVTLRHLLTHQSGLPSTDFDFDREKGMPTLVQVLNAQYPAINKPAFPEFTPGSKWSYSNIGYALIQQILEDVTNKSFQKIAEVIVFKPLKMNSSTFDYPLPPNFKNSEAKPHNEIGQEQPSQLETPAKAQGGLMTTPEDLAKLMVEIMNAYNDNSKIFSKELAQNLVHNELEIPFKFFNQKGYMGLGVGLIGENEYFAFLHSGYSSPGTVCFVIGYPEVGKGAVIAANSANGEQLYLEIIATLANYFSWPNEQFFNY